MRTEAQMLDLILDFARLDDRIRIVSMNGSRVNPQIPPDIFQDYDIVYFVEDLTPYIHDLKLIAHFGETIIFQLPDEMGVYLPNPPESYAYLMQFVDGTRIDLTFRLLTGLEEALHADNLTKVLLDKDESVPDLPPPSDGDYLPQAPSKKQFDDCCNEFWWLNPYVAKGLWREELIGPRYWLEDCLRDEVNKMLTWYFGILTDFNTAPGKQGRFFPEVFSFEIWQMVHWSYSDDSSEDCWESLYTMGNLFRRVAKEVAGHFGYAYPQKEDDRVSGFIRSVQQLSPDATSFSI